MPGIGKSTIQCEMAACASTGRDWPDGTKSAEPINVIMVTAEDSLDHTVVPRLIAAGADLDRIAFIRATKVDGKERSFLISDDLQELEKAIREKNAGLVTIDPITAFQGRINSNSPTDVRGQLGPLKRLAECTNAAFSTITHPPKSAGERPLDQFIGSQSYIAAVRIGHLCIPEVRWNEDDRVTTGRVFFTNPKNNLHEMMTTLVYRVEPVDIRHKRILVRVSRIRWDNEPAHLTADQAIASTKAPPRTAKVDDFLQKLLADGPMSNTEVMAAARDNGFTEGQIKRAKERLKIASKKDGLQGGWKWSLPEDERRGRVRG
jgi:putative DNA primase/helicase